MGIVQYKNFAYLKGPKGDKGDRGPAGDRGPKGDQGIQGLRGPAGTPADNNVVRGLISGANPITYNELTGEIGFDSTTFATKEYVDVAINDQMLFSSDDLAEGTINLYYSDTRSRQSISGGTGVEYNPATGVIEIGQSVGTTSNVIFGNINASGNVQIDGNLTVSGTTITINSETLSVADNMIYLNDGSVNTNPDLGFAGNYNDGTYHHAGFFRDASDGYWKAFDSYEPEPDASPNIDTTHPSFNLSKIWANEFKGNLDGISSSATRLQTPRTISGVSFDGSANITLDTTHIAEGTNNYFTPARARNSISVSGDLAYDHETGIISYVAPTYSLVATSNDYNDLYNKPFIPSILTDLDITDGTFGQHLVTDGSGNFYFEDLAASAVDINIVGEEIVFGDDPSIGGTYLNTLHPVAISGNYNALNNLPSIPTAISQLTNDSLYLTSVSWTQVTDKPAFAGVATSGTYLDLTGKPFIPSDLSHLTDLTGIINNLRPGSWNDLTDKPEFIEVSTLKSIVADSTDFADFKTRIASL